MPKLKTPRVKRAPVSLHDGPMHLWFELSYASYLVLPRALLQEMPIKWQAKMVALLREMGDTFDRTIVHEGHGYTVQLRDQNGRYATDPLREYRRPDAALINDLRKKPCPPTA